MVILPRLGKFTQGTIFCGAYAEDYQGLPVWGYVITARCDTVHDKTPLVNYVPVVRVEDWLKRQGGIIVLDRAYTDLFNQFKNLLKQRGLSENLLDVHEPIVLARTHFKGPALTDTSKKAIKERSEAALSLDLATRLEQVRVCLEGNKPTFSDDVGLLTRKSAKTLTAVLRDLVTHKLAGYHFISDIEKMSEHLSAVGYVALLREIHHIPRRTVAKLTQGISRERLSAEDRFVGLDLAVFDFAYPVAEMVSPWVEHLMQSFCSLFGRVGVTDIEAERVAIMVSHVCRDD